MKVLRKNIYCLHISPNKRHPIHPKESYHPYGSGVKQLPCMNKSMNPIFSITSVTPSTIQLTVCKHYNRVYNPQNHNKGKKMGKNDIHKWPDYLYQLEAGTKQYTRYYKTFELVMTNSEVCITKKSSFLLLSSLTFFPSDLIYSSFQLLFDDHSQISIFSSTFLPKSSKSLTIIFTNSTKICSIKVHKASCL